jgi:DNA topoisomerase I
MGVRRRVVVKRGEGSRGQGKASQRPAGPVKPQPTASLATSDAAQDAAEEAGLRYTSDARPGIRRVRRGRGFSYHRPDGERVTDQATLRWINSLMIPPAWRDVWISTDRRGHLLATGRDDKERKQYLYHPRWREVRDADKFDSLRRFGERLPRLRKRVEIDLAGGVDTPTGVMALVVRLLDETLIRVGNREYARDNETFGLTTLRPDHVDRDGGDLVFDFRGKGGSEVRVSVPDPELVTAVVACQELGGQQLFSYLGGDDLPVSVDSDQVNSYLDELIGNDVTAKDFRTWGATAIVAGALAVATEDDVDKAVLAAIDLAAERLGNTRDVCRASYVHPAIPDAYRSGELALAWRGVRRSRWMDRTERLTLRVLDGT